LRVTRHEEDKKISTKYYFIPGINGRERSKYIEEMTKTEKFNETEEKILLKYGKVLEASMDL
jgi:hypothetical protein